MGHQVKKLIWAIGLFICTVGTACAEIVAPDKLIESTVNEVIAVIKADKSIQEGDQQKTLALVDEKVLPHFDFERMTQLAVGKYWRRATPAQKQALANEFRNMLVRTYAKVFSVYRDQVIEVKSLKMFGDDESTVQTVISKPGTPDIPVNYELKKKPNGWKVFDIYIEGVSMVISYRGTFSSQIEENGIEGLIKLLSDKNTASITSSGKAEK